MRADDLAFLSWLQVVAVMCALIAAVEWAKASMAYNDGETRLEERLNRIVAHLSRGGLGAAIAIAAYCLSQTPFWLRGVF